MAKKKVLVASRERAIVYKASDRERIARSVRLGQKIKVLRKVHDEETNTSRNVPVTLTVTGKYPAFIHCVDSNGLSRSIDYFDFDKIRKGVAESV